MVDRPYTIATIAELLEKLGYKAKIENDVIQSATSGMNFVVRLSDPSGDQIVQFSLGVRNKIGFDIQDANMFNKKYRFGKVYIDDDNDVFLEFEFLVNVDLASTFERSMLVWDGLVSALLREVEGKATSAVSAS